MTGSPLATPWAALGACYSLPGSFVLKLALGEAPADVPTRFDVRWRAQKPATRIDGGPIDRLIRHYADAAAVTRVHAAASTLGSAGHQHLGFDDIEHVCGLSRTFRIDVPPGTPVARLVDALSAVATVEAASPQYVCCVPFEAPPQAPDLAEAWAARNLIGAAEAMAYEPGDPAVVVAVVDTGIALRHPELTTRLRAGFDTVQLGKGDLAVGLQLLGDRTRMDTNPNDAHVGHGTGCAGIISALGAAMPPGLAGRCQLLPIRVLGAARLPGKTEPVGIGAMADIDSGMKMAIDLGAKVLNLSFGTADYTLDTQAAKPHADVVRYGLARGCVLVAASGNSGAEEIYWPAAYDGVIAVGSVGTNGRPSTFSTRGAHVACCAPGEGIVTAGLSGYQRATGTSFAAPFATAAAALLVSRAQRRSYPLGGPAVRRLLTETATPFAVTQPGCGSGILNAHAALQALDREIDRGRPDDAGEDDQDEAQ